MDPSEGPGGPGQPRRALAAVAKAAGIVLVFLAAAAAGVLLHLGLGAPRRFATARVNAILESTFKGKIVVERVGTLHLTRLAGIDVHVLDPEGRPVLHLADVGLRLRPCALIRSLASGKRRVVRIPELTVDDVEAAIEQDATGKIGLLRAFEPRTPSTGGPGPGRGNDVSIAEIRVRHAWVHGHLAAVPILDADLERFEGAFRSTPEVTAVDVEHLFVRARGPAGASPEGTVVAHATLPAAPDGAKHVRARYDGRVGEIPIHAEGSLDDELVAAVVDVPEAVPSAIAALAPGRIHLGAPVSAHAEVHGVLPTLRSDLRVRVGRGEIAASGTVTLPEKGRTDLTAAATVDVKDLDASLLDARAPASAMTAHLAATVVSRPGGKLSGSFHLESEVGWVSGQIVPAIRARGAFTEASVDGTAQIAERGAPTVVTFSLHPREGERSPEILALQVDAAVPDLDAIPRAGPIGRGRARAHVDGVVELDTKRVTADARVEASGIAVKGVTLARGLVTARAGGTLDAPRFTARVLGTDLRAGGYLFPALDASASGSPRRIAVALDLTGSAPAPSVAVRAHVEGARLRGDVTASFGEAGKLAISAPDVVLGGPATHLAAWKNATGSVALDGSVDLGRLLSQLPEGARPVGAAAGTITIAGKASRSSRTDGPTVDLQVATKGLALAGKQEKHRNADGSIVLGPEPWHTAGVDGSFGVKLSAASGFTEVSAEVHDGQGPLATVAARARLPLAHISRARAHFLSAVRDAPFEASLTVARHSLDALPPGIGVVPLRGDVELAAALRGTARAPTLTLDVKGTDLSPRVAATCVRPMNVEVKVDYDGDQARVRLSASHDAREVLGATATVKVSAAEALTGGPLAWEASGDVALASFPLDAVGALLHQPLAGTLSGKVALEHLHRAASLDADLDLRALAIGRAAFPRGEVKVALRDGALAASARLDERDGHAEVGVTGAVAWGANIAPALDVTKALDLTIRAKNLRAAVAAPFVQGVFSEIDGRIDTDAKIHVEPGAKDGTMTGAVALRDGIFEVPQIGQRFRAVKARVIMQPWGVIRFDDVSAQGPTGALTASAQAELSGLSLRRASARVRIEKGQSLPIALEGVPMGRVSGDVVAKAQMSPDGRRVDVDVDLPTLRVDLPRSTGHAVQPLEPDQTVRVGVRRGRDFVALPLGPPDKPRPPSALLVHAAVALGEVRVTRDTTVDVTVTGKLAVDVRDRPHVSGQIQLERGKLDLEGKQFLIDHGVVSFVGPDPSDPLLVATAYWDAPDGTRVFADFSGHVTSGKLALRAQPPRSQDEILSLILFGSSSGSFGAEPPPGQSVSTGLTAAGLAGATLTRAVNKAISGVTSADITTRVDTSKVDSPRPELAVQLTKSVSASLGYKLGVPAPGENPDRTELTVDWRFIRNWSVVAVVGDQGSTALDLQWRMRY